MKNVYVTQTMTGDEKILHEGTISLIQYWRRFAIGFMILSVGLIRLAKAGDLGDADSEVLAIQTIGFGLLWLASPFVNRYSTELVITCKRVVGKYGLIRRKTFDLKLTKVENVQFNQGILAKVFGYGNIILGTAGGNTPINGVKNVIEFRKKIVEIQEKNQ